MTEIVYELRVDTNETDRRFELLHGNVRRYGTIYNTIASAVKLKGQNMRDKSAQDM